MVWKKPKIAGQKRKTDRPWLMVDEKKGIYKYRKLHSNRWTYSKYKK